MTTVGEIGEHQLLKIINQYCDRRKNGDDGAILALEEKQQLVVTTDVLVEQVHFSQVTTPPQSIGYRAVTANLSDIAAMGAMPLGITVGLSLQPEVEVSWIEDIYQGMQKCLQKHQVQIIGGDITKSSVNTIAITALGQVKPENIIYRHTAQPNDLLLITGHHGLSKAGLELLLSPEKYSHISQSTRNKLIKSHQYPQPRLDVIKLLSNYQKELVDESSVTQIVSGMDSSDGLADAIVQICQQSHVGARIDYTKISPASEISQMNYDEGINWVLYGGEDFELVLSLKPKLANWLQEKLGSECQIIGRITSAKKLEIIDEQNKPLNILLNQNKTFQHF